MSVNYLRISVTDRCNLGCIYCNPLDDCDFIQHEDVLTFEEIYRIVGLFAECGIKKVRLTGGEPLVRRNITQLVRQLTAITGVEELSLTTNGVLLEPVAAELKEAGLQAVNVSVDSAERGSYKQITGFDFLPRVTKGIYRALEVGLTPVKINSVIIRGLNDSQELVAALAEMSVYLPVTVRFIEYCPTSKNVEPGIDYVPNSMVRKIIERRFGPLSSKIADGTNGPALYFKVGNSAGAIGFISGRSSTFCRSCNRLRLTSDGKVLPCLYSVHSYDVKKLIRNGASDRQLRSVIRNIINEKGSYTKDNSLTSEFSMRRIGG